MKLNSILAMVALLLIAMPVYAQDECINLTGPHYFSDINPGHETLDPVDGVWNPDVWNSWPPTLPIPLNNGDEISFGMNNGTNAYRIKDLTLTVTYQATAAGDLSVAGAGVGWVFPKSPGGPTVTITQEPASPEGTFILVVNVIYDPQPEWEWILLRANVNNVQILDVDMVTSCCLKKMPDGQVPSLTQYGMIALVVLILAAGAMVMVRRQKAMATR